MAPGRSQRPRPDAGSARRTRPSEAAGDHHLADALALLDREGSPLENVRRMVRLFGEQAGASRCEITRSALRARPDDAAATGWLHENLGLLQQALHRTLLDARSRGELPASKDPHSLSHALVNSLIGIAVTGATRMEWSAGEGICAGTLDMLE